MSRFSFRHIAFAAAAAALAPLLGIATAAQSQPAAAAKLSAYDVRGVKPGMTLDQGLAALAAAGFPGRDMGVWTPGSPGAHTRHTRITLNGHQDLSFVNVTVAGVFKTQGRAQDVIALAYLPAPNVHAVYAVHNEQTPAAVDAPNQQAIVAGLIAKYGPPSHSAIQQAAGVGQMGWYWNAAGQKLGDGVHRACSRDARDAMGVVIDSTRLNANSLAAIRAQPFPAAAANGCALGVAVELTFDQLGRISLYRINLVDFAAANQAAARTAAVLAQRAQAIGQQQQQRSNQITPKL